MQKDFIILVIGFILILNCNQQCIMIGDTPALLIQGTTPIQGCVPTVIANCAAYDYLSATNAAFPVSKCVICDTDYILVGIAGGSQKCQNSQSQSVNGCTFYAAPDLANCLKCKPSLNALPVNSGAGYICTELPPIKGDGGVQFTSCKQYAPISTGQIVICVLCNAPPTGTAPTSFDCSIRCFYAQSIRFYMGSTGIGYTCVSFSPSPCSLWADPTLRDCLSCYSPYTLITIGKQSLTSYCQQRDYGTCILKKQLIPQCDYYDYDQNNPTLTTCAQCTQTGTQVKKFQQATDFANLCTIGDKPTVAQPDGYFYVTVPVYAKYYPFNLTNNVTKQCGGGGRSYESNCFKLSQNGLQCQECRTGYLLITQYKGKNTQTRCVKLVYFCQFYDWEICLQCIDRYYLSKVDGQQFCKPVSDDCLQFQPFGGKCLKCASPLLPSTVPGQCEFNTTCPDGQYFNQSAKTCIKGTIENCKQYTINRPDDCLKCLEGYKSRGTDKCQKLPIECKNTTDMYFVKDRGTCKRIDPLCIDWIPDPNTELSVLCTNCGRHYLNEGTCLKVGTRRI